MIFNLNKLQITKWKLALASDPLSTIHEKATIE